MKNWVKIAALLLRKSPAAVVENVDDNTKGG